MDKLNDYTLGALYDLQASYALLIAEAVVSGRAADPHTVLMFKEVQAEAEQRSAGVEQFISEHIAAKAKTAR